MVVKYFSRAMTTLFGSRNDRLVRAYRKRVERINAEEPEVRGLSDAQLKAKTQEFRQRQQQGEPMARMMPQAMAVAREVMDRAVGIRNIFNPLHQFDPSRLDQSAQGLYAQVQARLADLSEVEVPGGQEPIAAWMQVEIPTELYEAVRKLYPQSRPPFRARPFDVQLIGGMVLSEGKIAEMRTGEGKTIVAPLACYLACLENLQCHVVTVNDYLVQRDRDWVFPFYYHLGLAVGAIHPFHMQTTDKKQEAYSCNVVYGTNSEFGFDYLRDNMKLSVKDQVQKRRAFCIIDEVDSILIDEARTPLIISGPAREDQPRYDLADSVARHLMVMQREWETAEKLVQQTQIRAKGLEGDIRNARDKAAIPAMREEMKRLQEELPHLEETRDRHVQYYELEPEKKAAHLTHDGVAEAQKKAGIGSFYVGSNMDFPHLLENALRAHAIYQRDKDYVVQQGEVIIVDEFTGRLMIGRQWSDGLHQAVEAKEKVKIKEETQTLATVTIQNFFKLYQRLAGMTGTAITEGTEFHEIYRLDVVCIPTNVNVIRDDRDDLVFLSAKDKWTAILDEIHGHHRLGRPVLVGTTSVEKSEMLATMLNHRFGIRHEVLNAKQHEREAQIVAHAGELGAVMIATNMAGRGTDIKLTAIDRGALVRHWQINNMLPREAAPAMSDEELLRLSHRHQARIEAGLKPKEVEAMTDAQVRLALLKHWVQKESWVDESKRDKLTEEQCLKMLDQVPSFLLHRLEIFQHVNDMGGLHIVGTERHEARRIDNQLRGRAGRQGDCGSSRFFISLEDELMQLFAGKRTLTALSKFGMKEGDAIEHPWITKSVERAQRKVEERNYEIRKNLLEYDEVMEYQRNTFYGLRQRVLEGRGVAQMVADYITDAVDDAVATYLDRDYVPSQAAEWCRQHLDVSVEPAKLRLTDPADLKEQILKEAQAEIRQTVDVTLGEYMSHDVDPQEWDLRGLSQWAMTRFSVDLKQNQLRTMNPEEVKQLLSDAAMEQLERKDLSGVQAFLASDYVQRQIADWARTKFDIALEVSRLRGEQQVVADYVLGEARAAYVRRETRYPAEFAVEMTYQIAQHNLQVASEQLTGWVRQRYELFWPAEKVLEMNGPALQEEISEEAKRWLCEGKLEAQIDQMLAKYQGDDAGLTAWFGERFGAALKEDLQGPETRREQLIAAGRAVLRNELETLERFVLLQILDHSWKDHLYAMDQLKDSIGLRGYAERDPRIEYKREGAVLFTQMQKVVRDRVTDLIYRARLGSNMEMRSVYAGQRAEHQEPGSAIAGVQAAAAAAGSDEQQQDLERAQQAGGEAGPMSRKQRRAAAAGAGSGSPAAGAEGAPEPGPAGAAPARRPQFKERKRKRH